MTHAAVLNSEACLAKKDLKAWLVCLSAGLFFFYEFFQLNIFDVITSSLLVDFQLNATELSWVSSTYLWGNLLFLLPAGIILDHYSSRKVILSALLLCIIGTLGFGLSHSFLQACFFHSLSGIGNAFCFLACVVLTSHWFAPKRQALVIGVIVTMAFMGGFSAHTPFAYLTNAYGWRHALFIDGLLGLVFFIWIFLFVKDNPYTSNAKTKGGTSWQKMRDSFRHALINRQNWLAGLYTGFLNLPIMVLCALWGASYLSTVHQLEKLTASAIISLIFIGSMIGCPLLGYLSDKQGARKPMMLVGAIGSLLTLLPLFLPFNLSISQLSILFFCLGFFTSSQVIGYPLIAESNRHDTVGAATAVASMLIMGLAGVAQIVFGYLMHYLHGNSPTEAYTLFDFQLALWIFPLAAGLAIGVALLMKETHCQPLEKRS